MWKLVRPTAFVQVVVWTLVVTTFVTGICPLDARAMLAPPTASGAPDAGLNRSADLQSVQRVLEAEVVRQSWWLCW